MRQDALVSPGWWGVDLRDQPHIYTVQLLLDVFSRLFAEVRKLEKTNIRNVLEDCIRKQ